MYPFIFLAKSLQDLERTIFGTVIYKAKLKFHIPLGKIFSYLPNLLIKIRQCRLLIIAGHDHRKYFHSVLPKPVL